MSEASTRTHEVPSWRFREDRGILFTGMEEPTYLTYLYASNKEGKASSIVRTGFVSNSMYSE